MWLLVAYKGDLTFYNSYSSKYPASTRQVWHDSCIYVGETKARQDMKITHEELEYILKGLSKVEDEYLDWHRKYKERDIDVAADECVEIFHKIHRLSRNLRENKHDDGTDIAYELV